MIITGRRLMSRADSREQTSREEVGGIQMILARYTYLYTQ